MMVTVGAGRSGRVDVRQFFELATRSAGFFVERLPPGGAAAPRAPPPQGYY